MSQQAWCAARPGGVRLYALLVLAVLAGLVAMHGLGPVVFPPPSPSSSPPPSSSSVMSMDRHTVTAAASAHTAAAGCEDCAHVGDDGGNTGGHAEHADSTCAASGTSGGPALPALLPAGVVTSPAVTASGLVPEARLGGRAPPSLSELQLLRI